MKISVVSSILSGMGLDESLGYLSGLGVQQLELAVGGYPGKAHADAVALCRDASARNALVETFSKHGMEISALAVHGNCVHPDRETAATFETDFRAACEFAGQLKIERIVTFSGCPGSDPNARQPNWVTCAWPPEYPKILEWQWNEVLIPYWRQAADFARAHGVKKIALEMHPGFCVYNPKTLLRLRAAVGDMIGANLDPSHLFWQGMEIPDVIRELGDAIYYFHAKDTRLSGARIRADGVLDTGSLADLKARAWSFCTLGYGHGAQVWKEIFAELKTAGYDGTISIEHEDGLMSPKEGLEKAVSFLKEAVITQDNTDMWWA